MRSIVTIYPLYKKKQGSLTGLKMLFIAILISLGGRGRDSESKGGGVNVYSYICKFLFLRMHFGLEGLFTMHILLSRTCGV
jgi:hypothetical protein